MNIHNSPLHHVLVPNSNKINKKRQEFWNGTLLDNYNFLMSEELICHCKSSLEEPFYSLNDLTVHHVSYNEFEKQYVELSDWCEKISDVIKKISSNTLTCYLRQKSYEELYEQGLIRLRMFNQYSNKLIERFPDLNIVIQTKKEIIYKKWNELESRFISYLDEDFDRIIQDLHNELFLFEEWIITIEEQLERFNTIRNEKISFEDFQELMKLQDEIKSKNSRVSSVIEICDRLKADYQQQIEQIPFDYASDLENRWHQLWINSVEVQCKLEERFKILNHSTSLPLIDEDDIIPFNSSEYEKISVTSSNNTSIHFDINTSLINRKRSRSPNININIYPISLNLNRKMLKSKRRRSLNYLPSNLSPSTFYYSLTNINDYDDKKIIKKQKKTLSKLDIGYASEDDYENKKLILTTIKKSQSDSKIQLKKSTTNILSSLTQSLPLFQHIHLLPKWWRYSITSAYDTCSNPDIDMSIEETKKSKIKPSLLMYSKKYTKFKKYIEQKSTLISNSYDASTEYTDQEQSENDVDTLSSDLLSLSPINHYQNSDSLFYNRYTTTTTTTGYSSDIELETTTIPSKIEDRSLLYLGEISQMNTHALTLSPSITSNEVESSNTLTINDKIESSEPCWDGYQNPLFYPLNSQDMDSMETILKWDDQFFEIDQLSNSTSDDDGIHIHDNFNRPSLWNNNSSSISLITSITNKQQFDSDSDLDDFNYVINESEKQLFKTRQSLEKKKRQQQQQQSNSHDRNQRKYDEILRTCETNIQCLEQILKNLHRSKNSRLNNIQAIELLQKYLSDWHDMRQQVNSDRKRARHLLHISQEIIKLKLRLDEELSHINTTFNPSWFDNNSLNQLKDQISYEIDLEKENRQKLTSFYTDLHLSEEHLKEYRMAYSDASLSFNIDEHLHNNRLILEQFSNKMDSYRNQLHTLLTMIDNLLSIENHIEQKLTSFDYPIELQELQTLIDNYERMIPNNNNSYLIIKNHCEYKLDIYKKMFNDLIHKQDKHVSFDRPINFNNNNNSTNINSSTTSSTSSTPPEQQYIKNHSNDNFRKKKTIFNQYRQTETRGIQHNNTTSKKTTNKQSTTSSYISDDCKVLYIETVIEVPKPIFYEHTINTLSSSTTNTEHHHNHHIPHNKLNSQQQILKLNRNQFFMDSTNKNHDDDSTDDDLYDQHTKPVNSSTTTTTINYHPITTDHLKQQGDSGIEYDQTSSSSTIYNQQTSNDQLIFPTSNQNFDPTLQPSLIHRIQKQSTLKNKNQQLSTNINQQDTCWNHFKQTWLRSLLIGLLILLILFLIYLFALDTCSRSAIFRRMFNRIIYIEQQGLPTI
ncbi:unnamed protein product [Rotaria sordida]|uniref:KASH domain-containing protein n=1 Tax=Rotaria sordida TaxID=392033 RepID=A0A814H4T6_9BILA|nr:unnamed protein product [Rotaria sordida]